VFDLGLAGSDLNCKLEFLKLEPCVLIPTNCEGFNKLTFFKSASACGIEFDQRLPLLLGKRSDGFGIALLEASWFMPLGLSADVATDVFETPLYGAYVGETVVGIVSVG
jgi:hypothetical protein